MLAVAPVWRALLQERCHALALVLRVEQADERLALGRQRLLWIAGPRALNQPLAGADGARALAGGSLGELQRPGQPLAARHHDVHQADPLGGWCVRALPEQDQALG